MSKASILGAALAASLALAGESAASPPGTPTPVASVASGSTGRGRWYGWQSIFGHLAADAAGALFLARMRGFSPNGQAHNLVPLYFGVPSHLALSLAVHAGHGQWSSFAAAAGLHGLVPGGFAVVGTVAALFGGLMAEKKIHPILPVSVAIGSHVAWVIDVAAFSYLPARAEPTAPPRVLVLPQVVPLERGLALGVGGVW